MLLEDGEEFILLVRVPSLSAAENSLALNRSQFAPVKRAVMITIKLVE